MKFNNYAAGRWVARLGGLLVTMSLVGCGVVPKPFVDPHLRDVDASQFKKPDPIHPVQLLFDFKTKGVENPKATDVLKARVADQVAKSGLFGAISEAPVQGGALLTITVDHVAVDGSDGMGKAFASGLTFGLVGTAVTDGYIADGNYVAPGASTPIVKEVRHAIHTMIGNHEPPPGAVASPSLEEAATTMLHQVVSHLLNDISHDPAFR